KIKWLQIELDKEYLEAIAILRNFGNSLIEQLKSYGLNGNFRSKKGLKELRDKILAMKSNAKFTAISVYTVLFNVIHMQELLETQGVHALLNYYNSLKERKKSRAIVKLLSSIEIKRAIEKVQNKEHPKLSFLLNLIKNLGNKKIIVFAQYRVQVEKIVEYLKANNIKAELFLGKGKGFSQKKQKEIIEKFRNNDFDVLVSTSIGEEGLDIPSVDIVIFYEPVPSEIRSIQRKGRAGRSKIGEIYILITKDTRDEYYFWSAFRKEKKMSKIIKQMKAEKVVKVNDENQTELSNNVSKSQLNHVKESDEKQLNDSKGNTENKKNEKKQTTINDFLN
ncbi:MAG: helicase-related protein, partial [Candidatus Anstonellales archaeon]